MKIKGPRITLVAMTNKDKEDFYQLAVESENSRFWYGTREKKAKGKKAFFQDWNKDYFNPNDLDSGQCFWIVVDGNKIGQINSNKLDTHNKRVELDIIIGSSAYTEKGLGSEVLKVFIEYLFKNLDLHKIEIEARANNPRAVSAYQKVGFVKEGILRKHDYFDGEFVDCVRLGLLKEEWLGKVE